MKIYVTKYALTDGINELEASKSEYSDGVVAVQPTTAFGKKYYHKNDYCLTKKDAIVKALDMRTKKIASLKKQIKRLEAMEFK